MSEKLSKSEQRRIAIHAKFGGRCAYCGEEITVKQMQIDHVIPQFYYSHQHACLIVKGKKFTEYGVHDPRNLFPSCKICNNWKHNFTVEEFRKEIAAQVERLRKYSAQFRMAERYSQVLETQDPVIFYFEHFEGAALE